METSESPSPNNFSKDKLEMKKLELEIKHLNEPFIKRKLFELLTFLIALCSVFAAFYSGLFDVKSERLELRRDRLEASIEKFKVDSASIKIDLNLYQNQLDSLTAQIKILETHNSQLKDVSTRAVNQLNKVNALVSKLSFNYILTTDDGEPLMTDNGEFLTVDSDPVVRQLKIETGQLRRIFDISFDKSFE